jgi:hypothetical protein
MHPNLIEAVHKEYQASIMEEVLEKTSVTQALRLARPGYYCVQSVLVSPIRKIDKERDRRGAA